MADKVKSCDDLESEHEKLTPDVEMGTMRSDVEIDTLKSDTEEVNGVVDRMTVNGLKKYQLDPPDLEAILERRNPDEDWQAGLPDSVLNPRVGKIICVIHMKNDGLECARNISKLNPTNFERITKTAQLYMTFQTSKYHRTSQYFLDNYAHLEPPYTGYGIHRNCYATLTNKTHVNREIRRENKAQCFLDNYAHLEPPYTGYGIHKNCYNTLTNKRSLNREVRRENRAAAGLYNPERGRPRIYAPASREYKAPTGKLSKHARFLKRATYEEKIRLRWSQTPRAFSERLAIHTTNLSRKDTFLQTIPSDFDIGEDPPVLDICKGTCVICAHGTKMDRYAANVSHRERLCESKHVPYGGKILLTATLKNDVVIKTRIQRSLQRKFPITYHHICFSSYTRSLDHPDEQMVQDLQDLLSCLYADPSTIEIRAKHVNVYRHASPYDRVNFDDVEPNIQENEAVEPDNGKLDDDENNDENNDDFDDTFDIPSKTEPTQPSLTDSESYKQFIDIVQTRIYDKSEVLKFSVLYDIYTDLSEKSGDMNVMDSDTLRSSLVQTFPTLQFHQVSLLSSALVYKPE